MCNVQFDVELLNGASVKLTGDKALELTKEVRIASLSRSTCTLYALSHCQTGGEDFSYRTSVESIEPQVGAPEGENPVNHEMELIHLQVLPVMLVPDQQNYTTGGSWGCGRWELGCGRWELGVWYVGARGVVGGS